jgi:glucosylglycerol-phosphate synthase
MNLVAKEFIASRVDGDGVLVLSEFAGAAVELEAAVATNPFSDRSMDVAICQALDMSEPERRDRMLAMQRAVRLYDLSSWGQSIEDLLPRHQKSAA